MFDSATGRESAPFAIMVKKRVRSAARNAAVEGVPGQAERLKTLRTSLGYSTASAFAAFLDIGVQRYGNFETGMPLSREVAFRLVQKIPGLSLDWLYFGKADGLPLELARRLGVFDRGNRTTP